MSSEPFKFPETVPTMEPELLVQAFRFAIETVLGGKGLSREVIRASVDWRQDKTPADKELDYGTDLSNAFVEFFSGDAMLVYAAILRTFSMFALIDEEKIDQAFLEKDDQGNVVVPESVLKAAAQIPLKARQGFDPQDFHSTLPAVDQ